MRMCGGQVHLRELVLFFKPFDFQGLISVHLPDEPLCQPLANILHSFNMNSLLL